MLRPEYLNALAAALEAPSDDGHCLGPTDCDVAALALRSLAQTLQAITALPAEAQAVIAEISRDLAPTRVDSISLAH